MTQAAHAFTQMAAALTALGSKAHAEGVPPAAMLVDTPEARPHLVQPLDASAILQEVRTAATQADNAQAQKLLTVLRLTHQTEPQLLARVEALCRALQNERRRDLADHAAGKLKQQDVLPWPLVPPLLWELLQSQLHEALRLDRHRRPRPWFVAMALWHGEAWLQAAAELTERNGAQMRRSGGWLLPWPKVDGDGLVAELRPNAPAPGEQSGQVLRLTWLSTARLVAQSRPGQLAVIDPHTEPT
jgi:hypothetical protein